VDFCHPGTVRERLAVAGRPGPVGVNHRAIAQDHGDQAAVLTDGDDRPVLVSLELGERETPGTFRVYLSCADMLNATATAETASNPATERAIVPRRPGDAECSDMIISL